MTTTVECEEEQKTLTEPVVTSMFSDSKSIMDQSYDSNAHNQCVVCNKKFKSPSKLHRHLLIHTGEKPFKCEICKIGFRQEAHLKEHNRTHHNLKIEEPPKAKKPTKTSVGRKSLQQLQYKNYLNGHHTKSQNINAQDFSNSDVGIQIIIGKNEDENHFQNDQKTMGPIFKARTIFKNSINQSLIKVNGPNIIANNDKQKQCVVCGKKFNTPSKLKRHFISHTGERPFSCEICEKKFAQECHLKLHYKRHHPDLPMLSFKDPNIKPLIHNNSKNNSKIQNSDDLKEIEHENIIEENIFDDSNPDDDTIENYLVAFYNATYKVKQ